MIKHPDEVHYPNDNLSRICELAVGLPMINIRVFDVTHDTVLKGGKPISHPIWDSFDFLNCFWVGLQNFKLKSKQNIPDNKDNHKGYKLNTNLANKFGLKVITFVNLNEM